MGTRYDVSTVPPLGGYVARRCPVRAQLDVLRPCEPLPPSPIIERRATRGIEYEAKVFSRIATADPSAVWITGDDREERERATVDAMLADAPVILGGRLPTDLAGRRVGEPDILCRSGNDGYRPVDVKHHLTLDSLDGSAPALCSALAAPSFESARPDGQQSVRKHKGDLLQLAHYQRILEAAGLAATDGRWAGIIGVEGVVVWHNLDEPMWTTPSSTGKQKRRSTMEVYDFEFDFRLDIISVAHQHLADAAVDPLVVPCGYRSARRVHGGRTAALSSTPEKGMSACSLTLGGGPGASTGTTG